MSNFEEAYKKTMGHEGGYVNDPDDAGAETYKGISRRFHPSWPGWIIIDNYRRQHAFPEVLDNSLELMVAVKDFYKVNFWDRFWGDEVSKVNFAVAMEIFDNAVNMGVGRSVRFLQEALNVLNRNGILFYDLSVDGSFGAKSLDALMNFVQNDPVDLLLKVLNILQGAHYIKYMGKDPVQEKYARGWFARVKI
jgi:lysozyme family protein